MFLSDHLYFYRSIEIERRKVEKFEGTNKKGAEK